MKEYVVSVGSKSRGWSKVNWEGSAAAAPYWNDSNQYTPDKYELVFMEPPSDLGRYIVTEPTVTFSCESGTTAYVTIAAYDTYMDEVQCTRGVPSNECIIQIP